MPPTGVLVLALHSLVAVSSSHFLRSLARVVGATVIGWGSSVPLLPYTAGRWAVNSGSPLKATPHSLAS